MDREQMWNRTVEHLQEKYAEGGYLKLWIPESDNARQLAALRELIHDTGKLRELFDKFYMEIISSTISRAGETFQTFRQNTERH